MATASAGERRFWGIVVRTAIVGLLLISIPFLVEADPHSRLQVVLGLLERLGDALLIAVILAVFIERSIGNEHFNQLIVDIFGRKLPPELVDHLLTYFRWDFVRQDWSIEYLIQPVEGKSGEFTLTAISSYWMENRSARRQSYHYRYSVELGHETSTETEIRAATIANIKLSPDEIKSRVKREGGYVRLPGEAVLEPFEDDTSSKYEFHSESIQGFRGEKVSPYWALHPVVGTTFKVYYPEESFTVVFDATFEDHSGGGVLLNDRKPEGLVGRKWEIRTPILRGQGFIIRCTHADPPDVMTPSGATQQT